MKQETSKNKKKWLLPVIIAAAVLVVAAIVLAIFLLPKGQDAASSGSKLYWNVDRLTQQDPESGLSLRQAGADGLFSIRFAVDGEQVELKCADKRLVNVIDAMSLMGLEFDADGLIVDALAPETVAKELAKDYFVKSFDGTTLTLNSSQAMSGMALDVPVTENTAIYDVSSEAEVVGAVTSELSVMDKVMVYGNEAGETTHVFRLTRAVEAEVYHRLYRRYDKVNKVSTRVPDENGVYTIEFAHKGQLVDLKCRDKEVVEKIDYAYDAGAQMGLIFDEEGYIIKTITAAEAIKGKLRFKKVSVAAVDGNTVSFESRYYSNTDIGETAEFVLDENVEMYLIEADCEAHFIGEKTDHLKVGDRCYVYTDFDENVKMIFVERRMVDSKLYYNVTRMYDSVALETTRVPDSKGYYVFTMAVDGKQVELKTKDKALASRADSMTTKTMGLKLNGNIIEEVYGCNCVTGIGVNSNRFVTDVMGGIVRVVQRSDWESGGNYMLAPDCQIYDVTGSANVPIGSVTELKPYDWVSSLYLNENNQITHMYIQQRYIEDGKLVYHLNWQWDSEKKETARVPNEEGYYVFEMLCEGKKITMKTKDKNIANYIDRNKYPVTVRLSGEIIKGAYSAGSCLKGGVVTLRGSHFQKMTSDGKFEYITSDLKETRESNYAIAKDCTIYNYSKIYDKYRGEKTTLQKGDIIYCMFSYEDNEIHKMFVYSGTREADTPLYWHVSRRYNKTTGETKRVPDENGWYVYQLAVDGEIKTFRTKDKEIANKVDGRGSAFSLLLDGDIIMDMITYPKTKAVQGIAASAYTVTAIDGDTITATNYLDGSATYGDVQKVVMKKGCKIYNVSSYAENFGAATQLEVGDRITCYTDNDGLAVYVYITLENTRAGGVIDYCEHCDKEVIWNAYVGSAATTDTHYYLPADRTSSQLTLGYTAAQLGENPDLKPYEMILDLNGHNLISSSYRAFLLYNRASLTIMDSVGTGTIRAGVKEGNTGGLIRISGSDINVNIYGGKLYADENSASQYRGGLIYGSGSKYTLNIYGGTLTGGVAAGIDSTEDTKPGGGNIYISNGTINMYGGTISGGSAMKNDFGSGRGGNIWVNNTTFNMYGGTIEGGMTSGNGGNVQMDSGKFNMTGGTITGGISGGVSDDLYLGPTVESNISGGTIEGEVYVTGDLVATFSGKPVLSGKVTLAPGMRINLGELTQGAHIAISADGVFTGENEKAADYAGYFHPIGASDAIAAIDTDTGKALTYINYVPDGDTINNEPLVFDEGTTNAVCPVCGDKFTWIAIDQQTYAEAAFGKLPDGAHVYLAEDITYTGTDAFISSPGSSMSGCLHLNGKNLTASNAIAISNGGGIFNVMGNGIVTGYQNSSVKGGAVGINTSAVNAVLNVYGGTYQLVEGAGGQVIAVGDNGGGINLYKQVTVVSANGNAVYIGSAKKTNAVLGIYGTTITGNLVINGTTEGAQYTCTTVIDSVNITGSISVAGVGSVTLAGDPVIGGGLSIEAGSLITLGELAVTNPISVTATGTFTTETENAADYKASFTTPDGVGDVEVSDDGKYLFIGAYVPPAVPEVFDPAGTVCKHCGGEAKVWTELAGGSTQIKLTEGGHYYLSSAVTGATKGMLAIASDIEVCLYSDYQIKNSGGAKNNRVAVVVSGGGTLNYMGTGTFSGNTNSSYGAAITVDNGTVNLYGGTMQNRNANYAIEITANGGTVNLHKGVTVEDGIVLRGSATAKAVLNIDGGTYTHTAEAAGIYVVNADYAEVSVTGGTFSFDPSGHVAAGYAATKDGDVWTVAVGAAVNLPAICPMCNQENVTWTAVTTAGSITDTGHYYLKNDIQGNNKNTFTVPAGKTVCLDLNGCDITNYCDEDGPAALKSLGILNVRGEGTVKSNGSGTKWAPIYSDNGGSVVIYGGTYVTEVAGRDAVKASSGENSTVTIYGGSFSSNPNASFIAEGYEVTESEGTYTVAQKNP